MKRRSFLKALVLGAAVAFPASRLKIVDEPPEVDEQDIIDMLSRVWDAGDDPEYMAVDPDLADVIYNISPFETPIYSTCSKVDVYPVEFGSLS